MKKIFLSLVAFVIAILSYAQNTLVATLTHGDNITMYYGVDAFVKAHNAAVDGDIINLSGGKFNSTTITKGISIRGAGVEVANPTNIIHRFDINIPTNATERLSIEGCIVSDKITVSGTLSNAYFLKNRMYGFYVLSGNNIINGTFVNCNVTNGVTLYNSTALFVNSFINGFSYYSSGTGSASFINCVIGSGCTLGFFNYAQLMNCIILTSNDYDYLISTSSALNCVAAGPNKSVFTQLSSSACQNCKYAGIDIFKDGNGYNDLTDEAKATYLGTDGTPVGMYGGVMPFNQIPTYPRITKMNVANRTTADGKLSVEIEVSATE